MADRWFIELKETIIRKRRGRCEICGGKGTQLHHCLEHDMKRYHRILTCEENCMLVCEICHTSLKQKANNQEVKKKFAIKQILRGYNIVGWYKQLPLRTKQFWLLNLDKTLNIRSGYEHKADELGIRLSDEGFKY